MRTIGILSVMMCCTISFAQGPTNYDYPNELATPIHEWLVPCEDVNKVQKEGKHDFRTEKFRLLVPETASFGFVDDPSMFRECSLVYDSIAHALVYNMPGTEKKYDSIEMHSMSATTREIPEEPIIHGNDTIKVVKCEFTDVPINYTEPEVSRFSVPISDDAAKSLRQLWDGAVKTAKIPEEPWIRFNDESWDLNYYMPPMVLDGETYDIFVGKKCATQWAPQVAGKVQMLLMFMDQLGEAVHQGNKARVDSLVIASEFFAPLFKSNSYNPEGTHYLHYLQEKQITPKNNLSQLDETQRNSYLGRKALEVVKKFSLGGYPDTKISVEITGMQTLNSINSLVPEMRECNGKQFYEVILHYDDRDPYHKVDWPYKAKVAIWESNGQPMGVVFGNKWGHHFFANPYNEWVSHEPTQLMNVPR